MSKFSQYKATQTLKELAQNPYDLAEEGNLTAERLESLFVESVGYKLLYGCEKVNDQVLQALHSLAKEADVFGKMERMQAGEVMNFIEGYPSENRSVLHTAVRDFFDQPQTAKPAKEATALAYAEIEKLKKFIPIAQDRFTDMVMIAIGGSDLGPRATYKALERCQKDGKRVHFISNVDPDDAAFIFRKVDLRSTCVVIVSKSGTTLETATNEAFARNKFVEAGIDPKEHFVAVTGKGSPMDDPNKYLESFYIWDWVGGRYSCSSMVGGVSLAFGCGFDTYWELLEGAHAMDQNALNREPNENLSLTGALLSVWNHNFLNYPTLAIIPYSQGLERYAAHIQQVEMESNGKRIDQQGRAVDFETGPVIWGEPGTNGQHSFFQLIHQGTSVVPLEFIGYKEGQMGDDLEYKRTTSHQKLLANLFAQSLALATGKASDNPNKMFPGNRPSHILLGKKLTPYSMGALLSYFEHKVAFEGFIWGINSFDQEGVQLGKVLANKIINRMADKKGEAYPLADAYLKHLETL